MLSQIVRTAITSALQAVIILLVALALGVRVHAGALGWITVIGASALMYIPYNVRARMRRPVMKSCL